MRHTKGPSSPCIIIRRGEERRKKRREVLHLFRCYTHTPTRARARGHVCTILYTLITKLMSAMPTLLHAPQFRSHPSSTASFLFFLTSPFPLSQPVFHCLEEVDMWVYPVLNVIWNKLNCQGRLDLEHASAKIAKRTSDMSQKSLIDTHIWQHAAAPQRSLAKCDAQVHQWHLTVQGCCQGHWPSGSSYWNEAPAGQGSDQVAPKQSQLSNGQGASNHSALQISDCIWCMEVTQ